MKIISQFTDYYDYVAHLYGGGDPLSTYNRQRLVPLKDGGITGTIEIGNINVNRIIGAPYIDRDDQNNYSWISICGKPYLVKEVEYQKWQLVTKDKTPEIFDRYLYRKRQKYSWMIYSTDISDYNGVYNEDLVAIHKTLGVPVFRFDVHRRFDKMIIDGEIPNLGQIGFAPEITPEQMYQDISFFVGNVLKVSPEMLHPAPMTNKEKIDQHGFDQKISFRHRK